MTAIQKALKAGGVFELTLTAKCIDADGNITTISTTIHIIVHGEGIDISSPNTGDSTNIILYQAMALISLGCLLILRKRKKLKSE